MLGLKWLPAKETRGRQQGKILDIQRFAERTKTLDSFLDGQYRGFFSFSLLMSG
jgi:hypothetical protein